MSTSDVFIISAVRTAIGAGKPAGALTSFQPVELASLVMREAVQRAGIDPARLDDVIWAMLSSTQLQAPSWLHAPESLQG